MRKQNVMDKNRIFYNEYVAPLIRERFGAYERRIAVGIAGEGSDCFGYDDELSRDHDFGTGVCLWVTDGDMKEFGYRLSIAYNELVDSRERSYYTDRLRERRGVMTIHGFYSAILGIDCDTEGVTMSEKQWQLLDHSCLATAVNGEVFRDDLGAFSAFRRLLLAYYPDRIWRIRMAEQLHRFSSALQVNYARCMTRGDIVAAQLCKNEGMAAAMELFFLIRRTYPPYYKWTFRALSDMDGAKEFAGAVYELAGLQCDRKKWEGTAYHPNRLNVKDEVVTVTEKIAGQIAKMLRENGIVKAYDPYLESYVRQMVK